ncbi:MAG: hypothetical protein QM647_09480 [Asticcacaulis sp.]|uniref:hypothetical protein n=1 Tax=Asticcacaulis sp. TaxID=1872648 RepID=UPI0039E3A552
MRNGLAPFSMLVALGALTVSLPAAAQDYKSDNSDIAPLVHFEAVNPNEPAGDRLGAARHLAAAIVKSDNASPKMITDVGSFTGEFLEAFMQEFPEAKGQWTEPVATNEGNAHKRFARFGDRVSYVIGCAARDISQGCVPAGTDVLLTSWLSIHQDRPGIAKFYKEAADLLPSGGWVVNLDHVGNTGNAWETRLKTARAEMVGEGLAATTEGPPVHHADWTVPTLDEHLADLKAAGFDDVQVVWRRLDTVLIMARKH